MNNIFVIGKEIKKFEHITIKEAIVSEKYKEEWSSRNLNDFVCITSNENDELISENLYRISGFGLGNNEKYFILIKYTEGYYDAEFMKTLKKLKRDSSNKYLKSKFTILNDKGVEKVVLEPYVYPYIVDNSLLYTHNNNCFNIETGFCYSDHYSDSIESEKHFIINNRYNKNLDMKGVIKINKKDGSYEVIE